MKIRLSLPSRFSINGTNSRSDDQNVSISSSQRHNTGDSIPNNSEELISSVTSPRKKLSIFESPRKALRIKKSSLKNFKSSFLSNSKRDLGEDLDESRQDGPQLKNSLHRIRLCDDLTIFSMNPLQWIEYEALPKDLFPKILSFAGPQTAAALSLTSKTWRQMVLDESVWRTLSEDLGKWTGKDPTPASWHTYYCNNPCVPVDYSSIENAFEVINTKVVQLDGLEFEVQRESIRLLLRPGVYVLEKPIVVNALNESVELTIETVDSCVSQLSAGLIFEPMILSDVREIDEGVSMSSSRSSPRSVRTLGALRSRSRLRGLCRSNSVQMSRNNTNATSDTDDLGLSTELTSCDPFSRAVLIMKTARRNTPVVRITRGTAHFNKIDMIHNCEGTDIWNGNAAVQIQPPLDANGRPSRNLTLRPTGVLNHVGLSSISGRGAVTIDGGNLVIKKSYIHSCAATGIYVGGPGSVAKVEESDIINNGHGNITKRRGIARGHSGVYLEQGATSLFNCNISNNSLTGISAISPDNAALTISDSDIVGNGTQQIELPPAGSVSWRKSICRNNSMSQEGTGKSRSGLIQDVIDDENVSLDSLEGSERRDFPQDEITEILFSRNSVSNSTLASNNSSSQSQG